LTPEKDRLLRYFRAAVAAADPGRLVASALRPDGNSVVLSAPGARTAPPPGSARRIFLVGGGKAGRAMGGRVAAGVIAVPRGAGGASGPVRFVEAGHPLPDHGSRAAAREILGLLDGAVEGDLVIALLSGGGSAMISAPADGISSEEKAEVVRRLLRAGADIASINAVRKHLSAVKGGLLARAACPAAVRALLLSDVPGDDPSVIASGPFSPDPTTYADAVSVLSRHGVLETAPATVRRYLAAGAAGKIPETPKPGDPAFARVTTAIVGSNRTAMDAAWKAAEAEGSQVVLLPAFLLGEARECARAFCARLREAAASLPAGRVVVLVAGGETTVKVRGSGTGGRNQEFALVSALELAGREGAVLAAGTDGIDGPTDAAGAFADGTSCERAAALGLSPGDHLENSDSHPFFRAVGDLVVTGPTGTNVADLAIGIARGTGQETLKAGRACRAGAAARRAVPGSGSGSRSPRGGAGRRARWPAEGRPPSPPPRGEGRRPVPGTESGGRGRRPAPP
jgi:hydroxypyruvate reductase